MIPFSASLCWGASNWKVNCDQRRGGISVERSENGINVRMIEAGLYPIRARRLSHADWVLLESLESRGRAFGRFLTMHKRRRKRLVTRSISEELALLDDIHHGQVKCALDQVSKWPFNAFTLDNVTGGRSLPVLCVHLFHFYGLIEHFNLDVATCWKFFSLIEEGYHSNNPYHNSIHATDVTQAMHCFLQNEKIRKNLTPLEIMAALIAAVTHDLDHPGVNQPFLIATSNHLAALYQNTSVLENHHWRAAIGCLLESHVTDQIKDCRKTLQTQISSLILATDINRQQEFLAKFKRNLDLDSMDMSQSEDRHFVLQIALKCADISNPCRPWDISKKWSEKVCEEFFRQGEYERQLNLPVTALCDKENTTVPKIQIGFFKFIVLPLFAEWHRFLSDELSDELMRNLDCNHRRWQAAVAAEDAKTDTSEGDIADEENPSSISPLPADRRFLAVPDEAGRLGRRHSVPLSLPPQPVVVRTTIRRESLAIGERRNSRLLSAGCLEEDEEDNFGNSSLSLLSSSSAHGDRPVSAENLLPEPSIASITTGTEASRLSSVFHRSPLTRQHTFPPLQPYVRQRQMSTCSEVLRESNRHLKFEKRDQESPEPPRGKVAKLDSWSSRWGENENEPPSSRRRNPAQLSCRRGSAPAAAVADAARLGFRRGSVPVDVALLNRPAAGCRDRRGSVPLDSAFQNYRAVLSAEWTTEIKNGGGGKARGSRSSKILRRRSSGGPELFGSGNWRRLPEGRRGSLPVDVLIATYSGDQRSAEES